MTQARPIGTQQCKCVAKANYLEREVQLRSAQDLPLTHSACGGFIFSSTSKDSTLCHRIDGPLIAILAAQSRRFGEASLEYIGSACIFLYELAL